MAKGDLPIIEGKEEIKRLNLRLNQSLFERLEKFAEFYQREKNKKPELEELAKAILQSYLGENQSFQRFLKGDGKLVAARSKKTKPAA